MQSRTYVIGAQEKSDTWSGLSGSVGWSTIPHTKSLQVRSPGRAGTEGSQSVMFVSHIDVPLSASPQVKIWKKKKQNKNIRGTEVDCDLLPLNSEVPQSLPHLFIRTKENIACMIWATLLAFRFHPNKNVTTISIISLH